LVVPIPIGSLRHPAAAGRIERRWLLDRSAAAARTPLVSAGVVLRPGMLACVWARPGALLLLLLLLLLLGTVLRVAAAAGSAAGPCGRGHRRK